MDNNRYLYNALCAALKTAGSEEEKQTYILNIKHLVREKYIEIANHNLSSSEMLDSYELFLHAMENTSRSEGLSVIAVYNAGKINGIRQERARRKGKASFDGFLTYL